MWWHTSVIPAPTEARAERIPWGLKVSQPGVCSKTETSQSLPQQDGMIEPILQIYHVISISMLWHMYTHAHIHTYEQTHAHVITWVHADQSF